MNSGNPGSDKYHGLGGMPPVKDTYSFAASYEGIRNGKHVYRLSGSKNNPELVLTDREYEDMGRPNALHVKAKTAKVTSFVPKHGQALDE